MTAPSVEWVEVGPRDGLQSWPSTLPTPAKVGLVANLLDCGFLRVEATSMVHPKWVPQLADAEAVLEALQDRIDRLRVLVPNRRGLERARGAGVRSTVCANGARRAQAPQTTPRVQFRQPASGGTKCKSHSWGSARWAATWSSA